MQISLYIQLLIVIFFIVIIFIDDLYIIEVSRTEWSPIWSFIIRVITKSDDRAVRVWFVYNEYDYRPNWTTR